VSITDLPAINATLNATSATLLVIAFVMIKARRYRWHGGLMIAAVAVSAAFLVSYLIYHANVGSKRFPVQVSWIRMVYFTILLTHTVLAAVIVPLVIWTLWRAASRKWAKHRRIGPWTFGIWLYVSITGVVIYWMLYHLPGILERA
jgi:uncharacterized membrane protein YozB (DUF420 family)